MNRVVHFEMPAHDSDRVVAFYSGVFGWQMQKLGPEMGDYILATTTETDENGPKEPGAINGGLYPAGPDQPTAPSFVIEVEDINAHMQKVRDAGGEIFGEPMPIAGVGMFVPFADTEGNRLSMLQPESR